MSEQNSEGKGSNEVCVDLYGSTGSSSAMSATKRVPLAQSDPREYCRRVRDLYAGAGAVILGNVLEWYDWTVYGYMEDLVSEIFMGGSHTATWLVFAVPFIARPLGSVLLGWVGDRLGRTVALNAAIWGMATSTVLQGCLPTVPGAEYLLVLLRIISGLSAGGEAAGVNTYMTEVGGADRDHTLAAAVGVNNVSGSLAFFLSNAVSIAIHQLPRNEQLAWAWRLPFLAAFPLGLASVLLRKKMHETEAFEAVKASWKADAGEAAEKEIAESNPSITDEDNLGNPSIVEVDDQGNQGTVEMEDLGNPSIVEVDDLGNPSIVEVDDLGNPNIVYEGNPAFEDVVKPKAPRPEPTGTCKGHVRATLLVILVLAAVNSCNYLPLYLAGWLQQACHFSATKALMLAALSKVVQLVMTWPVSFVADRVGTTMTMLGGGITTAATALPAFLLVLHVAGDVSGAEMPVVVGEHGGASHTGGSELGQEPEGHVYFVAFVVLGVLLPVLTSFSAVVCTLYMTSLFPAEFRGRGAGLGLGLASVVGGFTPAVCSLLARHADWLPGLFVTLLAVPSLSALLWSRVAASKGWLNVYQRPWLF